jgi:GNAT superfamily N-acetyltransferase
MHTTHPQDHSQAAGVDDLEHAGPAGPADPDDRPARLRPGTTYDLPRLVAMHARCSQETIRRRYHTAVPQLSARLAHGLLRPARGWSVVAVSGGDLVGIAAYAANHDGGYDVGLLVEDQWQRQGVGSRLLGVLARHARDHRIPALTCTTQPDNQAVPRTIRRAGFEPRLTAVDGLVEAKFFVTEAAERRRERANKLPLSETTRRLVPLLHARGELRQIHPVANIIDQAIRAGA